MIAALAVVLITYFYLALTTVIALIVGLPKGFPQRVLKLVGATPHNERRLSGAHRFGPVVALAFYSAIAVVGEASVYWGAVGPWPNSETAPDLLTRVFLSAHFVFAVGWTTYVTFLYLKHGRTSGAMPVDASNTDRGQ